MPIIDLPINLKYWLIFGYVLHDKIEKNIWVSCAEMNTTESYNVVLEYDTNIGFPSYYFPYANQNGYLTPFVAMQIHNLPGTFPIDSIIEIMTI